MQNNQSYISLIGCVRPVSFPYLIDSSRTLSHYSKGHKIIVLRNRESTLVYYHIVSERSWNESVNHSFWERTHFFSVNSFIPTILHHWFGGKEQNVSVFFYLTPPQVDYDDELATLSMMKNFKRTTKQIISLKRWIPEGNERKIVLRKPSFIAWPLSSFVEFKSDTVDIALSAFIRRWNGWLEKTNRSLQKKEWYEKDLQELKRLDWNNIDNNRRYRLICEQAVHLDLGEFQDWAKMYLSSITNLLNRDCRPSLSVSIHELEGILFKNDETGQVIPKEKAADIIQDRLENFQGCHMIPIHITFHSKDFVNGHMVALFLDTRVDQKSKKKTALMFDPNGEEYDVWSSIIGMEAFEKPFVELMTLFDRIGYRVVQSRNQCINRGQNSSRKCAKILSDEGYCMWFSYFAMIFSMLKNMFPVEVIEMIDSMNKKKRTIVLETFIGWLVTKYNRSNEGWLRNQFLEKKSEASKTIRSFLRHRPTLLTFPTI